VGETTRRDKRKEWGVRSGTLWGLDSLTSRGMRRGERFLLRGGKKKKKGIPFLFGEKGKCQDIFEDFEGRGEEGGKKGGGVSDGFVGYYDRTT